jgi:hypothetical protein
MRAMEAKRPALSFTAAACPCRTCALQGPYQQLSYSQQPLAAQPVMTAVTTAAAVQQQQQRQMAMAAGWGPHVPLQHCN